MQQYEFLDFVDLLDCDISDKFSSTVIEIFSENKLDMKNLMGATKHLKYKPNELNAYFKHITQDTFIGKY